MKKMLMVCLMVAMIAMSVTGAHAALPVNYYDSTVTTNALLEGPGAYKTVTFSGINGPFTSANLSLVFSGVANFTPSSGPILFTTSPYGYIGSNASLLFSFIPVDGMRTWTLAGGSTALNALNAAITNHQLSLTLMLGGGKVNLVSAKMDGPISPEPATMLLMGAGLAGLPIVRRLRKRSQQ